MTDRMTGTPATPRRADARPARSETRALIFLALTCVATIAWIAFFAWLNARALGLI
jgi:hypothetical protein